MSTVHISLYSTAYLKSLEHCLQTSLFSVCDFPFESWKHCINVDSELFSKCTSLLSLSCIKAIGKGASRGSVAVNVYMMLTCTQRKLWYVFLLNASICKA